MSDFWKLLLVWLAVIAAGITSAFAQLRSSVAVATSSPPVHIVTLRPGIEPAGLAEAFGLTSRHVYRRALNGFSAPLDANAVQRLKRDSRVLAVEPDGTVFLCGQTVPTGVARMGVTNFPEAHMNGTDQRIDVDVAVLDSGIQTNHPDLNVVQAVGLVEPGLNGDDQDGHGTHVAGTIGALDNGIGVVGVAPGARLWAVQVFAGSQGTWDSVLAGVDYIATNAGKICVVNASFASGGGITPSVALHTAFSNLVSLGVVVVAAAGNSSADLWGPDGIDGTDDDILPANLPEVMAVSAMNPADNTMADFSNYSLLPHSPGFVNSPGASIDLAAPGVDILSTWTNSDYATETGTSMAAPHVTGLVALYIAANGRAHSAADVYRIRQALIDASQPQSQWGPADTLDPDTNHEGLAVASEAWVPTPRITSQAMTPSGFQLSFPAVPGYSYAVQSRNTLLPPYLWTNLSAVTGTGAVATATVLDPVVGSRRFYRLDRQPAP